MLHSMINCVKDFWNEVNTNERLKLDIEAGRKKYPDRELPASETFDFFSRVIIPLAKKYGFDFSIK